jgi:hypothetical protein
VGLVRQSDASQQRHRLGLCLATGHAKDVHGRFGDVLQNGAVREQIEFLEDHAHGAPNRPDSLLITVDGLSVGTGAGQVNVADPDVTGLHRLDRVDGADKGRLAGAGRADEDEDFTERVRRARRLDPAPGYRQVRPRSPGLVAAGSWCLRLDTVVG